MTPSSGGPGRTHEEERREIVELKRHVAEMTELAVGMVADGTRALLAADGELSRSVISRDAPLDRYDLNIEVEAIHLVATIQPEGPELRTIEASIKIANCVDRIGRLGYDLGRYIVPAPEGADASVREQFRLMDQKARAMVVEAIDAFVAGDAERARAVFAMDDAVDALHREIQQRLITLLRKGGGATDRLAFELLGARHLERVADNACKIAEKAVYAITGQRRSEYPRTRGPERPAANDPAGEPDRAGASPDATGSPKAP